MVVAHSSLELADYPNAEQAYARVLALTPAEDESRAGLVENLAASIYKQGEQANEQANYRAAADHFLRIKQVAPTAKIRAAAEYDAGAALIRSGGLGRGRRSARRVPHDVSRARAAARGDQADRVRLSQGRAAVAAPRESTSASRPSRTMPSCAPRRCCSPASCTRRRPSPDRALAVYPRYVEQFPKPVEAAVETRFKIAEIYQRKSDTTSYHRTAGTDRPDRCGSGRRAHGAHALPRGPLGAGAGAAGLRELRLAEASAAVRAEPRGEAAAHGRGDGRRSASSSTTRSARSRRRRPSTSARSMATSAARCASRSGRPASPARSCRSTRTRSKRKRSRSRRRRSRCTRRISS